MGMRRWARIGTILVAHAVGVSVIGLSQFIVTGVHDPGACQPLARPFDRLSYWLKTGAKQPMGDLLVPDELRRLFFTLGRAGALLILLTCLLWSMRPFRSSLRLRSLMLLIALVPLESAAAVKVWNSWEGWDECRRLAIYCAVMEQISNESSAEQPPPDLELSEAEVR